MCENDWRVITEHLGNFIMKIRQNIDWAHLSFLSCIKADGHTWRESAWPHCLSATAAVQFFKCLGASRDATEGKCCRPSTVDVREIWRMMRRLCAVAQWWKWDWLDRNSDCRSCHRWLFTWPPGLFWHFVSLLPVEHKTISRKMF